jgi:Holliday junction resolvase
MNNKKLGNRFESELCELLFNNGFWTHNLTQNQAGQPADVIAVRNKVAYLIDCKVCSGKGFPLSRIEENQESSMTLWRDSKNGEGWFALKIEDDIYMIPLILLQAWRETNHTSMSVEDIKDMGYSLKEWVKKCK